MEKLQNAIANARRARHEGDTPAQPTQGPIPGRASAPTMDTLWSDIPEITPSLKVLESNRVVSLSANKAATPFDILRTKVLLQMRQNNWNRLAITSAMPGSGKTTMACNIALGIGRQKDMRAILFDLDLRRPKVGHMLGYRPDRCIRETLTGETTFAEQAVRVGDNVLLSIAKEPYSDPTRILLDEKTETFFETVEKAYAPDLMIFDLPPMLINDNTRAFLDKVDCALIVARANQTRYGQFDAAEKEIAEHTNVLGMVLNGSGGSADSYSEYDYGYGNY